MTQYRPYIAVLLIHFDLIIQWTAIAILATWAGLRAVSGGPCTIKLSPPRASRLSLESVFAVALVYLVALVVVSLGLKLAGFAEDNPWRIALAGNSAQLAAAVAVLVVYARHGRRGATRRLLRLSPPGQVGACLAGTILAIGLCQVIHIGTIILIEFISVTPLPVHETLSTLKAPDTSAALTVVLWLGAAAVAPFSEELMFRGLMQTALLRATRDRRRTVVIAALVFAAIHFSVPQTIPALFALGLILGLAFEKTGSIWTPIVIHAAFNLKTLIASHLTSGVYV